MCGLVERTGNLRIRFSVLWKDMQNALTALAITYPTVCWPIVLKYMRVVAAEGKAHFCFVCLCVCVCWLGFWSVMIVVWYVCVCVCA